MGLHEPLYSECDYAPDYIEARARKASHALLGLLVRHHPDQSPQAVVAYIAGLAPTPDEPDPLPSIVSLPREEDRIAVWVQKQKTLLPPNFRDWNLSESTGPSILSIQRIICARYNVTRADLVSARRTKDVIEPRQIAIYLSREMTTRSYPYIGGKFGGRDHTTALHAYNKISDRIARDQLFAGYVESLKQEIAGA